MGVIRGRETNITKNLSEVEKNMGVDLKLTKEGDLELSNLNDIKLIAGIENAAQAVKLKLFVEPGGILYHPELGTDLQIGEKVKNASLIKLQIIRSLSRDARFEKVDATVNIEGNTIYVELVVTLANTGVEIPLQFAVING
jgi:hypothetical protein